MIGRAPEAYAPGMGRWSPAAASMIARRPPRAGRLSVERLRLVLTDGADAFGDPGGAGRASVILPYDPVRAAALVLRRAVDPERGAPGGLITEEACAGPAELEVDGRVRWDDGREALGVDLNALEFVVRIPRGGGAAAWRQPLFLALYAPQDRRRAGEGAGGGPGQTWVVERPLAALGFEADHHMIADPRLLLLLLALRRRRAGLFAPAVTCVE